jgi:hypothetical protein
VLRPFVLSWFKRFVFSWFKRRVLSWFQPPADTHL